MSCQVNIYDFNNDAFIVKSMGDFMTDDNADCTVVHGSVQVKQLNMMIIRNNHNNDNHNNNNNDDNDKSK